MEAAASSVGRLRALGCSPLKFVANPEGRDGSTMGKCHLPLPHLPI